MTWQRVYVAVSAALPVFRFDQQKETCARCAMCSIRPSKKLDYGVQWNCNAKGGKVGHSCSVMRADDGPCGLDAKLFVEKP